MPPEKTESPGAFAARLTWPELEQRLQTGAVAVLPVGAACKEHGAHLPLNTDYLQAEWLAEALTRHAPVLVWPTVSYGYYPAFADYPGSVSITQEIFQTTVHEILKDVRRAGARSVVILNTGISTIEPLEIAISAMPQGSQTHLANVYDGPRARAMEQALRAQPRGGHADEIETSIMLVIAPERVALNRARPWTPEAMEHRGPFSRTDPNNPRYSPDGVYGDPTLATEEKGRRMLAAIVEDLLEAVKALASE